MITIKSTLTSTQKDLPAYAGVYNNIFRVPAAKVQSLLSLESGFNRILVSVNGNPPLHRSLMPDGRGGYFILLNREQLKNYGLAAGDEVQLVLERDLSEYGMPLPEELAEIWSFDDAAREAFHRLKPGRQRRMIHLVATPKGAQTRAKKAVQISEYLKQTGGVLDYKELNAFIKNDNANR